MPYAVFDTKADSIYKDDIEWRYHFPSRYLALAAQAVGSWIIYREPRANGGRMAYFAVAKLTHIERDPEQANHHYAYVDSFTEFDRAVSWQTVGGEYRERWLRELPQEEVGVQMRGKSIRVLEPQDFIAIVNGGLQETIEAEFTQTPPLEEYADPERRIKTVLVNQKVRERSFRINVVRAYSGVCALTGLSIRDLKGNPEAQAAHIKGVENGGPDTTTNGLALCATVHWLFDRHLVTLSDDLGIIFSEHLIPAPIVQLLEPQRERIILPGDRHLCPALRFVRFHREKYVRLHGTDVR